MLEEIYLWLESRTGIPYNFEDDIKTLSSDIVAVDNATWTLTIYNIIGLTKDALDAVDEFDDQIPPDFPSARKIKSYIAEYTRINLRSVMKTAFQTLGLVVPNDLETMKLTTIRNMTAAFNDLINKSIEFIFAKVSYDSMGFFAYKAFVFFGKVYYFIFSCIFHNVFLLFI